MDLDGLKLSRQKVNLTLYCSRYYITLVGLQTCNVFIYGDFFVEFTCAEIKNDDFVVRKAHYLISAVSFSDVFEFDIF
jgi:hypothetical protein